MPRKLTADMTLDDLETEILFTRAALAADPDAQGFVALTQEWLASVDPVRALLRKNREAVANADAARIVSNSRLDAECVAFADELYLAVGKDRKSRRWQQFFTETVGRFVTQALGRQVGRVQAWLGATDPMVEKHRGGLERWSTAAAKALADTQALGILRGQTWQARETLAEDLTRERDGLHDALSQYAREHGLARDWPDLFFRTEAAPRKREEPPMQDPPAPPADDK